MRRELLPPKGPWKLRSPSAGLVLSSVPFWSRLGYEARFRRTGRFSDTGSRFDFPGGDLGQFLSSETSAISLWVR